MAEKYAQWKWVTASEKMTTTPCELIYAQAVSDGGEIKDTILYDGENTNGDIIINLQKGNTGNITFSPKTPVKCQKGLYVSIGSSIEGVLVEWRSLSYAESRQ